MTVTVLSAVGFTGLGVWGWSQYRSAADWEQVARTTRTELGETLKERDMLRAENEQLTRNLTESEKLIGDLNEQVAGLRMDKNLALTERNQVADLLEQAPEVIGAVRLCASAAFGVATEALDLLAGSYFQDYRPLQEAVDNATSVCGDAVNTADQYEQVIEGLGL